MTHGLNLTLPLKQDAETQKQLKHLAEIFSRDIQPNIERALKKSELVHFARVLVIDDKYIQVITSYDGDHQEYTEFFRRELTPIFARIFSLAEGAPDVRNAVEFWEYSKRHNIQSLGTATDGATGFGGEPAGWLFSAYNHKTVVEIQKALGKSAFETAPADNP